MDASVSGKPHVCDDSCVCELHGTPLIYWSFGNEHACQASGCPLWRDGSSAFQFILRPRVPRLP